MQKGFSTIEVMIALAVFVIVITPIVVVVFGNQSFLVGGQIDSEAIKKAQDLVEEQQSLARKDFNLVNPLPQGSPLDSDGCPTQSMVDGVFRKKVCVQTQSDNNTKKVTVIVSWTRENTETDTITLETLVTKFGNPIGGDSCNSVLSGDWTNPQIKNTTKKLADIVQDTTNNLHTITDIDVYGQKAYITEGQGSVGPTNNSGSGANEANGAATMTWTIPTNSLNTSDTSYASITFSSAGTTQYVKASNFGFAIPLGAIILGIQADIQKNSTGTKGSVRDDQVKIVKSNGSIGATNKASASTWPSSDTYSTYGGTADLWDQSEALSWTPTDINNSNFGVVISTTGSTSGGQINQVSEINRVRIKITYITPFYVLNVTNAQIPTVVNYLQSNTISTGFNAVAYDGAQYAYVATNSTSKQFQVIDTSTTPATVVASLQYSGYGVGNSIYYKKGYVYLGLRASGANPEFQIIDVHSPLAPVKLGNWSSSNHDINAITVVGDYAYLAIPDSTKELHVLYINDKNTPIEELGYDAQGGGVSSGYGKSVYPLGDNLYFGRTVISGQPELYSLDATDIDNIISTTTQEVGESVNGVIVRDYLAFLVTKNYFKTFSLLGGSISQYTTPGLALPTNPSVNTTESSLDCEGNYMYSVSNNTAGDGYLSIIAP